MARALHFSWLKWAKRLPVRGIHIQCGQLLQSDGMRERSPTGSGTLPSDRRASKHTIERRPAMKKLSTAADQKCFRAEATIGLGLGDRSSWYCVWTQQECRAGTTAKHNAEGHTRGVRCYANSRIALETGVIRLLVHSQLTQTVQRRRCGFFAKHPHTLHPRSRSKRRCESHAAWSGAADQPAQPTSPIREIRLNVTPICANRASSRRLANQESSNSD
jgi:hypothetical protein